MVELHEFLGPTKVDLSTAARLYFSWYFYGTPTPDAVGGT
jgi:hypothetical protein